MAISDEYRELAETALDALRALLRETEPGTASFVHLAYADIKKVVGDEAKSTAAEARESSSMAMTWAR